MFLRLIKAVSILLVLLSVALLVACDGDGGGGGRKGNPSSTTARFFYDCDLQGLVGKMVMDVEAIEATGAVWGPGANPDITGVLGTGEYTLYVSGQLNSPTASYVFTGENQYADFSEINGNFERFRVEWQTTETGLVMIVNPFGPLPTQHSCTLTDSTLL